MQPIKPAKSLEAMKGFSITHWWPTEFGEASSSGSSSEYRYAYFAQARRLLIEQQGRLTTYDTASYAFRGALQVGGLERKLCFVSQYGMVPLDSLTVVAPRKA